MQLLSVIFDPFLNKIMPIKLFKNKSKASVLQIQSIILHTKIIIGADNLFRNHSSRKLAIYSNYYLSSKQSILILKSNHVS